MCVCVCFDRFIYFFSLNQKNEFKLDSELVALSLSLSFIYKHNDSLIVIFSHHNRDDSNQLNETIGVVEQQQSRSPVVYCSEDCQDKSESLQNRIEEKKLSKIPFCSIQS